MDTKGKTILIIDDEENVVEVLNEFFSEKGFKVAWALTGKEGLDSMRMARADLVLLDKNLPDMRWESVVKDIWGIVPHTPIIIITAYPSHDSLMEAFNMGISHYLEKPFDLDRINLLVEKIFRHDQLRRDFMDRIQALQESAERLEGYSGRGQKKTVPD